MRPHAFYGKVLAQWTSASRHNILLDGGLNAILAYFGFEAPLPLQVGSTSVVTAAGAITLAGTRGYLAPELLRGNMGPKVMCTVMAW